MGDSTKDDSLIVTRDELLEHWQGHRRLTRKVIEAFPEEKLFSFAIGSMRPFGNLAVELISLAAPTARAGADGDWGDVSHDWQVSKSELLRKWDEATDQINHYWPNIRPDRFQEQVVAFGRYPGKYIDTLLYVIDNEVHHRGQGYVYLRALGIEPPYFWER